MTTTAKADTADITIGQHADTLIMDGRTIAPGTILAALPTKTAEMLERLGHGVVYRG
ncbi:hypothetical protein [Rhodococcus sp. IEGM 1408]|uniref:hypothetical protein n=1 Tax=Rhodococcus sp. IEGM 1408 TaxID=3082220 RepID=UPI002955AA41|nr:hypothetical protein [Rhodococcus sp. IEGM 1408]MDV8000373.1 hypothetical protein [Rhodococcus sp. IEGM 1408]